MIEKVMEVSTETSQCRRTTGHFVGNYTLAISAPEHDTFTGVNVL